MAKAKAGERWSTGGEKPGTTARAGEQPIFGSREAVFKDLVMLFYATTGRLNRLKRVIASSIGLNSAEYAIVAALHRLGPDKGCRIKEIADYLHMAPENVTTAVGQLVQRKWVIKAIDPTDARAVTLRLHATGRKRIYNLTNNLRQVNEIWFREMNGAEIQMLTVFLERVLNGFDGAYRKARDIFPPDSDMDDGH